MSKLEKSDKLADKLKTCAVPSQSVIEKRTESFVHDLLKELKVDVEEEDILLLAERITSEVEKSVMRYTEQKYRT